MIGLLQEIKTERVDEVFNKIDFIIVLNIF